MRRLAPAALLLLAAACAPHIEAAGPSIVEPALAAETFVAADGTALPLRSWRPDGKPTAAVLALHGFNDHSNAFADVGQFLAGRGVAVYAYDQRGFGATAMRGLWPGMAALSADLTTAATLLRRTHPDIPLYLLGESMGGAVTMVAMSGPEPPPVDGVVLAAPAVWGRETMPCYQRAALAVASHTVPWLKLSGRGLGLKPSDNIEMLRALARDPLVIKETRVDAIHGLADLMDAALAAAPRLRGRALVMYGERDEIIPGAPTFRMLRSLPAAEAGRQRAALYADGYHMLLRDLQAPVVWADLAAWMADPLAALPSGADTHARRVLAAFAP
ncbi:MAG: alpha/beta hydrolase [Rhodospirillales bacterium]|jgi:alpha-beta hydrolase superfamily lysophospholipase|nr:alpha/beta hydrolase [Rhodospirillales bacterium]